MSDLCILLLGDTDRLEFRGARASLDALGRVIAAESIESAAALLSGGQLAPDVIVAAQAFPGQFSAEAIDRLRWLAPLARVVGLLGSWCEGEMRSGRPWPAAVRVYWHQWPARCARELSRLRDGLSSTWALPVTASEEERYLGIAEEPAPPQSGLIAVHTPSFEMQDWLSSACRRRGWSTVWLRPHRRTAVSGVIAAVFDAAECRGEELAALERMATSLKPAPIIALLEFPRIEDHQRALSAGASAVLSKPLLIDDLIWQMDRLVRPRVQAG